MIAEMPPLAPTTTWSGATSSAAASVLAAAPPTTNSASSRQGPSARSAGTPKISRNRPLPTRCHALACRNSDVNGVKARLNRFSNALIHRKLAEVLDCYSDPSVDRVFLSNLLTKCEAFRFRVGEPTIDNDGAHVLVVEFSYVDPERPERVSLRGMRLQLRKLSGDWRVLNLRRE